MGAAVKMQGKHRLFYAELAKRTDQDEECRQKRNPAELEFFLKKSRQMEVRRTVMGAPADTEVQSAGHKNGTTAVLTMLQILGTPFVQVRSGAAARWWKRENTGPQSIYPGQYGASR